MINNISRRENLGYLIFRVSKVFSSIETRSACVIMKNMIYIIYRKIYTGRITQDI